MARWKALIVLGAAQFLMVLDTSVMNVSITQLTEDFDTEVTAIQAVITLYTLVMAAFMITGGKLGDRWGRRRTFGIGMAVYGIGSALTAAAPTLAVLTIGWSVVEGLGAALVLPALAALVGGNYEGRERAIAYGVIGGLGGVGIAVGPLLGGWVTTYLTWRLVFVGEVVLVLLILGVLKWIGDTETRRSERPLDILGVLLSVAGLTLVVLGTLQSGSWGWLTPRNPPFTVLGFAPTVFVIALGLLFLGLFVQWSEHREHAGDEPLIRISILAIPPLRSGLSMLLAQNLILLGVFFTIPLYLQVVQGLNAFQTGVRLLPVSITMLAASMLGPALARRMSPRAVVQSGVIVLVGATLWLIGTIDPELDDVSFAIAMALMGIGLGLMVSQLANVVQSSVGASARSEVGGLQYTAQNLGSSLGTALIGSILIGALAAGFTALIADDPRISPQIHQQVGVALEAGVTFVPSDQVSAALANSSVAPDEAAAIVESYTAAQLMGLKIALLAAALIAFLSLWYTRRLPGQRVGSDEAAEAGPDLAAPAVS